MRLTTIRSAVYAVQQYESPAFSVDYIINAYAVSEATREHERINETRECRNWRWLVRERVTESAIRPLVRMSPDAVY